MLVWALAMVWVMTGTVEKMQQFAREHPDQVTEQRGPGSYSLQIHGSHPELSPDMGFLLAVMGAIVAFHVVMLGAAIVRRLHDSDVRGWIALVPLALLGSGLALMGRIFGPFGESDGFDGRLFFAAFANNLVYLAALGVLIYLLARKGSSDQNRFGDPPT